MTLSTPVWFYEPAPRGGHGMVKRHAVVSGECPEPGKVHLSVFMHPETDVRLRGALPVEARRFVEVATEERKASSVPYCVAAAVKKAEPMRNVRTFGAPKP